MNDSGVVVVFKGGSIGGERRVIPREKIRGFCVPINIGRDYMVRLDPSPAEPTYTDTYSHSGEWEDGVMVMRYEHPARKIRNMEQRHREEIAKFRASLDAALWNVEKSDEIIRKLQGEIDLGVLGAIKRAWASRFGRKGEK